MGKTHPFKEPRRAFLALFGFVSIAYFSIFIFSSWSLQQRLLARASNSNDITARTVLASLQEHLLRDPLPADHPSPEIRARLDSLVKQTSYGLGIRRVRIFSLEGGLIYSSDSANPDDSSVDDISEVIDSLRGSSSILLKSEEGADVLEYFAPLRDHQSQIYAVAELYFDVSTIVSSSATAAKRTLIAGILAFLIVAVAICSYVLTLLRRFEQERKNQEEAEQRTKELQELARTGMFISGLAHQLRNPVSILKGVAGALTRRTATAEQQPFLVALEEEVDKMEKLIESFLRFAQPHNVAAQLGWSNLQREVEQACQLIEQLHPQVKISRAVSPDIDIAINPDLLRESLINVFANSVDALELTTDPRIEVAIVEGNDTVTATISDNGPGFTSEVSGDPQLALRPFYTTKSSGSGLGLALVKKIVEDALGKVEIGNIEPHGARVTLILPRHQRSAL